VENKGNRYGGVMLKKLIVATSLLIFFSRNMVEPGWVKRITAEPPSKNFIVNRALKPPAPSGFSFLRGCLMVT
jgi:hypothetical protein